MADERTITPTAIRDGELLALEGLVTRRGAGVLAFCRAVCDPGPALLAAAEAFARFRAAVVASDDPAALNPEVLLLGATRHAAASFARSATPPLPARRRRAAAPALCPQVPGLLAGRADGVLSAEELDALAAHLGSHGGCAEVEACFRRAERVYRSGADQPVDPAVAARLVDALIGAAPTVLEDDANEGVTPAAAFFEETGSDDADDAEPDDWEAQDDETGWRDEAETAPPVSVPPPTVHDEEPVVSVAPVAPVAVVPVPAPPTAATSTIPRPHRVPPPLAVDGGPVYRLVLPAAAVVVAAIIILAISGVLGGGSPAPTSSAPSAITLLR